ncbi:MAG: hypothetical protein ACT4QG_11000 [Sporichthyaceae bacterium]
MQNIAESAELVQAWGRIFDDGGNTGITGVIFQAVGGAASATAQFIGGVGTALFDFL